VAEPPSRNETWSAWIRQGGRALQPFSAVAPMGRLRSYPKQTHSDWTVPRGHPDAGPPSLRIVSSVSRCVAASEHKAIGWRRPYAPELGLSQRYGCPGETAAGGYASGLLSTAFGYYNAPRTASSLHPDLADSSTWRDGGNRTRSSTIDDGRAGRRDATVAGRKRKIRWHQGTDLRSRYARDVDGFNEEWRPEPSRGERHTYAPLRGRKWLALNRLGRRQRTHGEESQGCNGD
jgi:hypothetical protein